MLDELPSDTREQKSHLSAVLCREVALMFDPWLENSGGEGSLCVFPSRVLGSLTSPDEAGVPNRSVFYLGSQKSCEPLSRNHLG